MIVIDTKTNTVHQDLSKTEVGRIVGVHRITVLRWKKARAKDGTHKETYNHFEIYFNTRKYKQEKGKANGSKPTQFK